MSKYKTILFLTDLEGRLSALVQGCKNSRYQSGTGLWVLENGQPLARDLEVCEWDALSLALDEGYYFVYGGDATDHNVGDVTVLRMLVDLKEKYPDRVTLIAGNRDLNKIRFKQELNSPFMDNVFQTFVSDPTVEPRWLPPDPARSLINYIAENQSSVWLQEAIGELSEKDPTAIWALLKENEKQLIYLRWCLAKNLNSPDCFEKRQQELKSRGHDNGIWETLKCFLDEELELRRRYLRNSDLGKIIGNITFVHGGITTETFLSTLLSEKDHTPETVYNYFPSQLKSLSYSTWLSSEKNEKDHLLKVFNKHLERMSDENSVELRDFVFFAMNRDFHEAVQVEFKALKPDEQFDDFESPLIARGKVNRQSLPSEAGLVGYNHINRDGDVVFEQPWLDFLHKSHCWDNVSGHIPQGENPRVVCQTVRFILVDTTFKKNVGIPNEDILRVLLNDDGSHSIECVNQSEVHAYPKMSKSGHFENPWGATNLIYVDKQLLPEKYQDKDRIEQYPWAIGPFVHRGEQKGYLCTQKHGPEGSFKTYTIILSEDQISQIVSHRKKIIEH